MSNELTSVSNNTITMKLSTQDGSTDDNVRYKVNSVRWYVITVVSLANILNSYLWATWGPISQSVYLVYGWTDNTLFWVVNITNITGFLSVYLGIYLIDVKGIRVSMIVCTITMMISTTSRIITLDHKLATILIAIGQGFNGIATSIAMAIPCVVSQTWFRVTERTTATAISSLALTLGAAAAFLLVTADKDIETSVPSLLSGPLTVSMPKMNGTMVVLNETDTDLIKSQMKNLHYSSFGLSVFLVFCCVVYLPNKPSDAPSKTASLDKYTFKEGVKKLISTPAMWHITAVYAIPVGFYGNWSSIMDVVIAPYGFSQAEAGWVSFYGSFAGVAGGLVMGRLADFFKRKMKFIIIVLYVLAAVMFTWFTCMCVDILPRSKAAFYITIIMSGTFISSSLPLFLEITCETSHPIAEGVTAGFLGMAINIGATVFMCVELIPNIDTGWANWALVGVYVAAIPALALFKAEYRKVDIDLNAM